MHYLVYLEDKKDNIIEVTVCDEAELINLLQHLDKKRYAVTGTTKLTDNLLGYKEFCQKEEGLETGKKVKGGKYA